MKVGEGASEYLKRELDVYSFYEIAVKMHLVSLEGDDEVRYLLSIS